MTLKPFATVWVSVCVVRGYITIPLNFSTTSQQLAVRVDAMSSMYTCDHHSMDLFSLALSCSPALLPDGGMDYWMLGS